MLTRIMQCAQAYRRSPRRPRGGLARRCRPDFELTSLPVSLRLSRSEAGPGVTVSVDLDPGPKAAVSVRVSFNSDGNETWIVVRSSRVYSTTIQCHVSNDCFQVCRYIELVTVDCPQLKPLLQRVRLFHYHASKPPTGPELDQSPQTSSRSLAPIQSVVAAWFCLKKKGKRNR